MYHSGTREIGDEDGVENFQIFILKTAVEVAPEHVMKSDVFNFSHLTHSSVTCFEERSVMNVRTTCDDLGLRRVAAMIVR